MRASKPASKLKSMVLRGEPDLYAAVNEVRWRLHISMQEFLRRAVARELAYNAKRGKREGA